MTWVVHVRRSLPVLESAVLALARAPEGGARTLLVESGAEAVGAALAQTVGVPIVAQGEGEGVGAALNRINELSDSSCLWFIDPEEIVLEQGWPALRQWADAGDDIAWPAHRGFRAADPATLVAHALAVPRTFMVRREVARRVGGCDVGLQALVGVELGLRVLLAGGLAGIVGEVVCAGEDPRMAALTAIVARHRKSLAPHAARILFAQDQALGAVRASQRPPAPLALVLRYESMTLERFTAQMRALRERFQPISLTALAGALPGRMPARAVAVTFDHGLAAQGPLLRVASELGVPVTVFPSLPEAPLHTHALEGLLLGDAPTPPMLELELGGQTFALSTASGAERAYAYRRLAARLRTCTLVEGDALLRQVERWCGRHAQAPARLALEAVRGEGVSVGSHGLRDLALPVVPEALAVQEVVTSARRLERALGSQVAAFSFPHGLHDARSVRLVADAGYACAVTGEARAVTSADSPWALPRMGAPALDGEPFAAWCAAQLGINVA